MKDYEILIKDLREDFSISKGLAKAVLEKEKDAKYYQSIQKFNRDFDVALEERINEPIERGLINNGRFDDRKLRYNGHTTNNGSYNILVGPTHYGEMQRIDVRSSKDREFFQEVAKRGKIDFNDPWAYFSSCFAVNAVPVTLDGYVHLFKRSETAELFPGHWHVIGGMLDTDLKLFNNSNPSQIMRQLVRTNIRKEFMEEVDARYVKFELTGLVRNGSTTVDFTHIANVQADSKEFLDGFGLAKEKSDHSDVAILTSGQQLSTFIINKQKITPAGLGAIILYLRKSKFYRN